MIAIGAALLLVLAGALIYIFAVRPRGEQVSTAPVTVVVTETKTRPAGQATPEPTAQPPAPTTAAPASPTAPTYPPLTLPGKLCGTTGSGPYANAASGNSVTSCEFAVAVQAAYLAAGGAGRPTTVTAYSPKTKTEYVMSCAGDQPVTCTGGNNAVVYLFGGPATFVG